MSEVNECPKRTVAFPDVPNSSAWEQRVIVPSWISAQILEIEKPLEIIE